MSKMNCTCPSPLHWNVAELEDQPICKRCGHEVSRARADEEMKAKFEEIKFGMEHNKMLDITLWGGLGTFTICFLWWILS